VGVKKGVFKDKVALCKGKSRGYESARGLLDHKIFPGWTGAMVVRRCKKKKNPREKGLLRGLSRRACKA